MDLWNDLSSFSAIPKRTLLNSRTLTYHPGAGDAMERDTNLGVVEQVRGGGFKRVLTATGLDQGNRLSYSIAMPDSRELVATCAGRSKGVPSTTSLTIGGSPAGSVARIDTEYSFLHASGERIGAARIDGFTLHDAGGARIGTWRAYKKEHTAGEVVEDWLEWDRAGRSDVLQFGAMRANVAVDATIGPELRTLLVALPIAICFGYR